MVAARGCFAAALATVALGLSNCSARRAGQGVDPRSALLVELATNPRDSAVHLRLARFELATQHRAAALRHFAFVETAGGLFGSKWSASDRRAYAMLLRERGLLRISHGQASAAQDLTHAAGLGGPVQARDLAAVANIQALQDSRHAADDVRNQGLRSLCSHAVTVGACADASVQDRVAFATWLWQRRAKRASYDVLVEVTQRSEGIPPQAWTFWLVAQAWWTGERVPGLADDAVPTTIFSPDSSLSTPAVDDFFTMHAERWQLQVADLQALHHLRSTAAATVDRAVEQALDRSLDEAWTAAALGEYFLLVGDPARARALWQRAYDAAGEPRYLQGLAVATATVGDSDAATIWATQAAAASGDPALPLAEVAGAMAQLGDYPVALTLLRQALALAGATDANTIEREIAYCLQKLGRPTTVGVAAASWATMQTARVAAHNIMLDLDEPGARAMLAALLTRTMEAPAVEAPAAAAPAGALAN